ncbi:MAG: ORF6N domain-containing protein [Ruminococcus sp.]|nr:ORF6N domain-containing protein [Ruminococcus sp.]
MNDLKITPIEHNGQRVLTTAQLAEAYGTTTKIIRQNFIRNKERYIEGVHYYCLKNAELQAFKTGPQFEVQFKQAKILYIWTEKGALLHAKSLNTDRAWEVYDFLVDTYFRVREISKLYNEDIYQKLEMLEKRSVIIYQKLEMLEQKIDTLEKNSVIRTDNIIKSIEKSITDNLYDTVKTIIPGFVVLYKKINSILYNNYNKNKKKK